MYSSNAVSGSGAGDFGMRGFRAANGSTVEGPKSHRRPQRGKLRLKAQIGEGR
jgi:hypothetical protein